MFRLFTRSPTARQMSRMAQDAKRDRYKAFHDNMARKCGSKIEWAE